MYLQEFKAIIKGVTPVQKTRDGKYEFVEVVVTKPARKDDFGEAIGKDDIFLAKAWNKKIAELPVLKAGDKVNVTLILQGSEGIDKNDSSIYHSLQLNVMKITKID